jgi:hypothetical protein
VKQHLAALRMLFDWLVIGHLLELNPAYAVRPKYVVKRGKTPVLTSEEARAAGQHWSGQKHAAGRSHDRGTARSSRFARSRFDQRTPKFPHEAEFILGFNLSK